MRELPKRLGRRYAGCTLASFKLYDAPEVADRQRVILSALRDYCVHMPAKVERGVNVVLFGTVGTGKDHMLVALIGAAVKHGIVVEWWNGTKLFGELYDRMDRKQPDGDLIERLVKADVLAISDPLPPWGALKEWEARFLFRVIDERYREAKPIWVTTNIEGSRDGAERLSWQILDRLKDDALTCACSWPSYRESSVKMELAAAT